jgi:hypothetical protein
MTKAKNTGSGEPSPRRHGISVITEPTAEGLAERRILDYRAHREKFIKWVLDLRKDPERGDVGYPVTEVRAALRWSVSPLFRPRNAPHSSSESRS